MVNKSRDGLACPSLRGLDPAKLARDLVSRSAASVASAGVKGGGISVATVDEVFALIQLGLDDRQPTPATVEAGITNNSPEAETAFRSALAPGALGLVPKLAAALQHRDRNLAADSCDGGGGGAESAAREQEQHPVSRSGRGQRDAVVLAAGHLTAMEQLVTRQNNTPALLMAHNALSKLLKNNWPWLVGGVVDAPRLLSRLCEIYRDGLGQLDIALAQADAKNAASSEEPRSGNRSAGGGAGDTAHLKKFGKLLATFGTRMACLLRHLGPECRPRKRREAFRLYAKATASVYPGLLASLRARDVVGDDATTTGGVAGCIIYPKAVEAFLSTTDEPPCCQSGVSAIGHGENASRSPPTNSRKASPLVDAGGSSCAAFSSAGRVAERERNLRRSCRCYEGATTGPLSGQRHDPWEALEALRPPNRPPLITDPTRTSSRSSDSSTATDDSRDAAHDLQSSPAVDPLGAVLLLCEFLRRGYGAAPAAGGARGPRRETCCAWVLDHLAALFPGWVDSAAGGGGQGGASAALAGEVSATLGVVVCRRAMDGEFQEAQVQLIEGCSCHPHPVCREVWVGALKGKTDAGWKECDPAAQEVCIQSLANAALDPRVSPRCRRRLGRALAAVCVATTTGAPPTDSGSPAGGPTASAAAPLLLPRARAGLFQACLSRLRGEQLDGDSSGDSSIRASGGGGGGGGGSGGGACALDLLRALPSCRSFSGVHGGSEDDKELAVASVSFARTSATTADLLRSEAARGVGGEPSPGSSLRQREEEENLVAGARFLAARPQQEVDTGRGGARVCVDAAAREVAGELGGLLASSGLSGALSERALSAITRRARVLPRVA
ncbi:unnamed protein product [Ectocarpus sp. CCAP 1310/34]|nr:unnamed protein product [Ectocarpus sp. CCAP 1310/34]